MDLLVISHSMIYLSKDVQNISVHSPLPLQRQRPPHHVRTIRSSVQQTRLVSMGDWSVTTEMIVLMEKMRLIVVCHFPPVETFKSRIFRLYLFELSNMSIFPYIFSKTLNNRSCFASFLSYIFELYFWVTFELFFFSKCWNLWLVELSVHLLILGLYSGNSF